MRIGVRGGFWLIPMRAMASRTSSRLLLGSSARYPLVVAPLAPKAHHRDRDACHDYSAHRLRRCKIAPARDPTWECETCLGASQPIAGRLDNPYKKLRINAAAVR